MTDNNTFYAPVTPILRDQRQRKQIINKKKRHNSCHALVFKNKDRGHDRTKDKSTN